MDQNEVDFEEKAENSSTSEQNFENNTFEVKQSLFDKIKDRLSRPKLGDGKKHVKTTSMGFGMWELRSAFRRGMEKFSEGFSNIVFGKGADTKNGFATTVIGNEEIKQQDQEAKEIAAEEAVNNFLFPGLDVRNKTVVIAQNETRSIIDNAKTAKDVEENELNDDNSKDSLDVEDMLIDDNLLSKKSKEQEVAQPALAQAPITNTIEAGEITVSTEAKKESKEDTLEK